VVRRIEVLSKHSVGGHILLFEKKVEAANYKHVIDLAHT
jgi:hypothetical protein